MAKYLTYKNLLFGILVLAFLLRFWGVWDQDLFGDEAADAFRSIGYVDYLGTSFQTQPVDWYKYQLLPWWTKLSFHDLPPFGILIMNFFFRVFGDSLLVARLPAIIAGILSAYFLYLIVKKLFSAEGGSATGGKDETLGGSLQIDSLVRANMLFTAEKRQILKKFFERIFLFCFTGDS